jgi:uncharacterized protein (DUF1778 family)
MRSNSTTADPVVSLRMSRRQRDVLDDAAEKLGISRAELLRRGAAQMIMLANEKERKNSPK